MNRSFIILHKSASDELQIKFYDFALNTKAN